MAKIYFIFLIALLAANTAISQQIEDSPNQSEEQYLISGLDSERSYLEDNGYKLQIFAINDYLANVSGGIERNSGVLGNFDWTLEVDSEKAGLWKGGKLFLFGVGVYGAEPSEFVGDYQFTDNIQGIDQYQMYQMWYAQSFFEERLNILAGVHDYNTEFSVSKNALPLLNASFWLPITIAQRLTSTYPTTGLGARAKLNLSEEVYALYGIYDGRPGDPKRLYSWDINIRSGDGAFQIAEIGIDQVQDELTQLKLAFGVWQNSALTVRNDGSQTSRNSGSYLVADYQLFNEEQDNKQGAGVFLQLGQADSTRNQVSKYLGAGITYTGLIDGRDKDIIWLGYNVAKNGSDFLRNNPGLKSSERVVELGYRCALRPYFALTPNIQFVQDPSMNPDIQDAVVLTLRNEIAF